MKPYYISVLSSGWFCPITVVSKWIWQIVVAGRLSNRVSLRWRWNGQLMCRRPCRIVCLIGVMEVHCMCRRRWWRRRRLPQIGLPANDGRRWDAVVVWRRGCISMVGVRGDGGCVMME